MDYDSTVAVADLPMIYKQFLPGSHRYGDISLALESSIRFHRYPIGIPQPEVSAKEHTKAISLDLSPHSFNLR
jgi:hypothetical protein